MHKHGLHRQIKEAKVAKEDSEEDPEEIVVEHKEDNMKETIIITRIKETIEDMVEMEEITEIGIIEATDGIPLTIYLPEATH